MFSIPKDVRWWRICAAAGTESEILMHEQERDQSTLVLIECPLDNATHGTKADTTTLGASIHQRYSSTCADSCKTPIQASEGPNTDVSVRQTRCRRYRTSYEQTLAGLVLDGCKLSHIPCSEAPIASKFAAQSTEFQS